MSNLQSMLAASVPLRILRLQEFGGPTDLDFEKIEVLSSILGEKGDVLLFGGGKPNEAADLANGVAEAVAILAFCPGGVTLFGMHFEVERVAL